MKRKHMQHMAVKEEGSIRIDIGRLESSINDMMPSHSPMPLECCIFKTPTTLKRHNAKAYIPDAFSIGPLHHDDPNLKATEKIKVKYLQGLIYRSDYPDKRLRTLITSIMEVEKEARECYAAPIDHYNLEELVKILVIDGCFIIELFNRDGSSHLREKNDPIFSISIMREVLFHDLILLENQVPWMVLERLFNLTKNSNDKPLIQLATEFFRNQLLPFRYSSFLINSILMDIKDKDIKHLVDLKWKLLTSFTEEKRESRTDSPSVRSIMNIKGIKHFVDNLKKNIMFTEEEKERIGGWEVLPSATRLVEAGIKFKRRTSRSILDIKFTDDGILEIPPLEISEATETAFRNLISFEQCYPHCEAKITSYAIVLDNLINTAKDMDILCDNNIIENWLSPEDAAQLFNKLYHDTGVKKFYYLDLSKQVNRFCQHKWPRWRALLVRNYFNTPWAFLSTLAAVILLILTFLQTFDAMKN